MLLPKIIFQSFLEALVVSVVRAPEVSLGLHIGVLLALFCCLGFKNQNWQLEKVHVKRRENR